MEEKFKRYSGEVAARIGYLIAGFIRNTLSETEHDELDDWISASMENQLLFEELTDEVNIQENLAFIESLDPQQALARITRSKKNYGWYWAAACIVLLVGAFVVTRFSTNKQPNSVDLAATEILPAHQQVMLRYSDGRMQSLQQLRQSGDHGATIYHIEQDLLTYRRTSQASGIAGSNELLTPKGTQFRLQLSDGTKVWLNAESTLKYPTVFNGAERIVELNGEAYFEVAHNSAAPFKVKLSAGSMIEVLGTKFNVNSYANDPVISTTLLEGKVKCRAGANEILLAPGEQALERTGSVLAKNKMQDPQNVIAWTQGHFHFRNASVTEIFRQLQRWYTIEVQYNVNPDVTFNADIPRTEPLSKILHLLEQTGHVHFKTDNNKVYVLP